MTVLELGITAQSTYLERKGSMSMLPLDEAGSGGGSAADELVQSTLDEFGEPMIAGKTHDEILSMSQSKRCSWYKKITIEEKAEAMQILECERRRRISEANHGENNPMKRPEVRAKHKDVMNQPEVKAKIKAAMNQPEERAKRSAAMTGENNPLKRPEMRAKMSAAMTGENNPSKRPEFRASISGENNPMKRPEVRAKHKDVMNRPEVRTKMSGPNASNWQGGVSFEPYCEKFNNQLKERIRNRDNRTCVLCGKGEIQNGQRLTVHHIDSSKTQGCKGEKWYLCALCRSCNSKPDTVEKEFLIVTNLSPISGRSGL